MSLSIYHHCHTSGQDYRKRQERRTSRSYFTEEELIQDIEPNAMDEQQCKQLVNLLQYSNRYEISIQFWPNQITVYVSKDGIDLIDYGGNFDFAIGSTLLYLERVNKKKVKNEDGQ